MRIETYEKTIKVKDYIDEYVNVEEFFKKCAECDNFDAKWSCPPFSFDVLEYWRRYDNFCVVGKKMTFEEGEKPQWQELMLQVKEQLTEELFEREREHAGSVSLSAGSCGICGEDGCTKKSGRPCRYPENMRYSIEALGGNVGLTVSKMLGVRLQWITEGSIPDYFVLTGGVLYGDVSHTV